jgi:DNA invertase Pin-like site-specific DNA recombinase
MRRLAPSILLIDARGQMRDNALRIHTGGPMGKMVLTVPGMVAEMELSFLKERQRAGIEAAKAKGVYKGRRRPSTMRRSLP